MENSIKVFNQQNVPSTQGTYRVGSMFATYDQLVEVLGVPTFNQQSGDGKVQVEWVVQHDGKVFTIYDWKTYSRDYTENELEKFHVGGKTDPNDFIAELSLKVDANVVDY